jgi:hypothetical protein
MVIRLTVAAIIVSTLSVVGRAQDGKPCPSGHICPVCSEDNGVRICKVDRPGPPLPQAVVPAAPLDISLPSAAAPPPSPPQPSAFQLGPLLSPCGEMPCHLVADCSKNV